MVFCIGRLWESSEPQRFEWVLALYYFGNTGCRFITRTCGAATRFTRNESVREGQQSERVSREALGYNLALMLSASSAALQGVTLSRAACHKLYCK